MKVRTAITAALRSLERMVRCASWRAGFVILKVKDIERMDYEARCAYAAMKKPGRSERDQGYFNGLADCFSKTAETIRSTNVGDQR